MPNILLGKLKTDNVLGDNNRDKLLGAMEMIIARFGAEFLTFLRYVIDSPRRLGEISFKLHVS